MGVVAFQTLDTAPQYSTTLENPLIPRSLLFGNPEKASPRLSPGGTKLAYLAPDSNNVLNVWIKDLAKNASDKKVTSDTKRGIRSFRWQYDEEHILYIQDKDGDENWHLYQTNLSTNETRDLTPYDNITTGIIAYNHKYPDEALIHMNLRDPKLQDVYHLDLVTGELKLDTQNSGSVIDWQADYDLVVRGAVAVSNDGGHIILARDNMSTPWREILTLSSSELDGNLVGFNEDSSGLYLLSSLGGNTVRLLEVDLKSGNYKKIADNLRFDIEEVIIDPITYKLEAIGYEGEKYTLEALNEGIAEDLDWLQNKTENAFHIVSRDLANKTWILSSISDIQSPAYYSYSRSNKELTHLFSTQPELDKYTLSPMQPISFTARDGMLLQGYLTVPANKVPKNLPLVLMVHGGPWARDSWGMNSGVQWLANRGYAVLQINFRGSTGYGKDHLNAGNREWGGKMHTDLLDGKQWAVDLGIADPNKVAIYGGSYGGYATLAALAFTPDEFSCGIDIVGPSNLISLMQTLPPYWSPFKAQMDLRIGCLETEPEFLQECSPLFKAHQINKPLLIAQGANDPRVKQAESDQIVQAMRTNNLPVEYLLFPDEGHGFARPENRMKFYAASEAFLAKYLDGRAEEPTEAESWQTLRQ